MMSELPSLTLYCHSACPSSGSHAFLNISSKPTLAELDKFIVHLITDGWEQVVLHLGVESSVVDNVKGANPGQCEEACRGVLNSWLNANPGTGVVERTWCSVLEALETSGHRQLADKLKREHFDESCERLVSESTSLPGVCATALWRGCNRYHILLYIHIHWSNKALLVLT